jgi:hypothetical protein
VVGCCEHGNELSGSIIGGAFFDWLSNCWFLKKDSATCNYLVGLPAMKLEVTVTLLSVTILQGAEVHPSMLMVKASYTEPVIQQ